MQKNVAGNECLQSLKLSEKIIFIVWRMCFVIAVALFLKLAELSVDLFCFPGVAIMEQAHCLL